jgi:hypothetical protein
MKIVSDLFGYFRKISYICIGINKHVKIMKNYYLQITKTSNGNLEVNSADGVFSSFVTRNDKMAFQAYCEEKANEWLTSEFGNYDGWSKEQRKEVAEKWLAAKDLSEGNYNYYFNLGSIEDLFREEVASLAKSMGIKDYKLTL